MKRLLSAFFAIFSIALFFISCDEKEITGEDGNLGVSLSIPAQLECKVGDMVYVSFSSGKGPREGDEVVFRQLEGEVVCPIASINSGNFSFEVPQELKDGRYSFLIRRGKWEQFIRDVTVDIDDRPVIEQKEGYNIYGLISCDGVGVPGVVVSDGVEVTTTDENGTYYLKSKEEYHVVFMSVPSGYEAVSEGVLPKFHKVVDGNSTSVERADWDLVKVNNEDHIMYVLGDMHLANRTSDLLQFDGFMDDLNKQVYYNDSKRQYALTLGDMTWDLYWYSNGYDLLSYVQTINQGLEGLQVFHTIGNHDHDMNSVGDLTTVEVYKKAVAPNFYSFNIGKVHYIVLDDILCTNDGSGSRTYHSSLTDDQLNWLRKDLSYVDKSKTLVITMHAQMYREGGSPAIGLCSELEEIVKGYQVHVMTAHTHQIYNNDYTASKGIYHHNSGAICATWWWTGHYTPGLGVCPDGSPAGYYMYEMNGSKVKWRFKPTGRDFSYMFRTYDRNVTSLTAANFAPNADAGHAPAFEESAYDWLYPRTDNYVYINVFDYDPSWKIVVKENGNTLTPELVQIKDPLHLVTYEAKRRNVNAGPTSSFMSSTVYSHIFRVKASSPDSTLEIRVTDRFGNMSKESMKRPKAFTIEDYR